MIYLSPLMLIAATARVRVEEIDWRRRRRGDGVRRCSCSS